MKNNYYIIDGVQFDSYVSVRDSHSVPDGGTRTIPTEGLLFDVLVKHEVRRINHKNGDLTIMATLDGDPIALRFWRSLVALDYKIFEGFDHNTGKPLYQVTGTNNEYVGEWHTDKADAELEMSRLNEPNNQIT